MAHVCAACGFDCSGLRAPPDPVYALPLVVCTGCGRPSVRRNLLRFWAKTTAAHTAWAIGSMGLRILAIAGLGVVGIGAMVLPTAVIDTLRTADPAGGVYGNLSHAWMVAFAAAVLVLCTLLVAVGLGWALGHHGRGRRALIYLAVIALMVWVLPNLVMLLSSSLVTPGPRVTYWTVEDAPGPFVPDFGNPLWPVVLIVVGLMVWVFGAPADRFARYTAQRAWLGRLARERRRRAGRRS